MKFDQNDYDGVIMAGRAMRPEEYAQQEDGRRWAAWKAAVATGLTIPPSYPGAIEKDCVECGIAVQIGPRQQEQLTQIDDEKVMFLCLIDAALVSQRDSTTIHDLGNPFRN